MARSTRQQRRQRRAQAAGTPPLRPAPRPVAAEEPPEDRNNEARAERSDRTDEGRSRIPGVRFLRESIGELRKVEWPKQPAVVSGTAVVLISCLIVGAFLYLNDQVWQYVVHHVLLR